MESPKKRSRVALCKLNYSRSWCNLKLLFMLKHEIAYKLFVEYFQSAGNRALHTEVIYILKTLQMENALCYLNWSFGLWTTTSNTIRSVFEFSVSNHANYFHCLDCLFTRILLIGYCLLFWGYLWFQQVRRHVFIASMIGCFALLLNWFWINLALSLQEIYRL